MTYDLVIDLKATGEQIRKMRRESGLTNQTLSEMLGISPQAVNKWQQGKGLPDLKHALLMARLFGVTVEDLIVARIRGEPG